MTVTVRDSPVVVIVILGKRVTVDGEAIYHDGTRPLGQVAADAVAELVARPLARPVRAVASDQAGTCTLIVHPNGTWSGVEAVTSTDSEHFPESGAATSVAPGASLPGVAVPHSRVLTSEESAALSRRRKVIAALAAAAVLVMAAGVTGRLSRPEADGIVAEPPPPGINSAPVPDPLETLQHTPSASEAPDPTRITGVARQRPGGPVRLTIRSSVAPLSVDVVLLPLGGTESLRRTIVIPTAAARAEGRSVQVFSQLAPQMYRWQVRADGRVVTGTVRVRAAEVVETPPPVVLVSQPAATPSTAEQPSRPPPSGPRGNEPVPPKPQP